MDELLTRNAALYKIGTATDKNANNLLKQKVWLPGMGSNHEKPRLWLMRGSPRVRWRSSDRLISFYAAFSFEDSSFRPSATFSLQRSR